MKTQRLTVLALLATTLIACNKSDAPPTPTGSGSPSSGSAAGSAVIVTPVPAPATSAPGSAEALWAAYQAAHVGATSGNVLETGRKIWPLLDGDAQKVILDVSKQTKAQLDANIKLSTQELAYRVLGEMAAARTQLIADGRLTAVSPTGDGATLEIRSGKDSLKFEATNAHGEWRLAASESLVTSSSDVFHAPAGSKAPNGRATLELLAEDWKAAIGNGTGWDAYNMLSPANRARLGQLIGQMGGSGAGDVAKVFEKTIVDRRNRGITITAATIEDRTADSAAIVLTYSNSEHDRFPAVHVDGQWWLEMRL
jgi:hypothetical protein